MGRFQNQTRRCKWYRCLLRLASVGQIAPRKADWTIFHLYQRWANLYLQFEAQGICSRYAISHSDWGRILRAFWRARWNDVAFLIYRAKTWVQRWKYHSRIFFDCETRQWWQYSSKCCLVWEQECDEMHWITWSTISIDASYKIQEGFKNSR
jgi:hypothetical protein